MSARVCFLRRTDRGAAMRQLRLVDHAQDLRWPEQGHAQGSPQDYPTAAAWVRDRLASSRSDASVAMLCLDVDGGVCSWLSAPSADPTVVVSAARLGAEPGRAGGGAFDFYAPGDLDSTIQPLAGEAGATRLSVLAISDVPARLLVDALDSQRVPVESVSTLWHAIAQAWDPSASVDASEALSASGPVTGLIVVDPGGRLVWCWSRAGSLLVGGSIRLRLSREGDAEEPRLDAGDAARLATEWLAWAVQVGAAPGRIVCVMTPGDDAAAFGQSLAKAWPSTPVDAVTHEDPIAATLRRAAARLESTPRSRVRTTEPGAGVVGLSQRPVRAHRRMHLWRAVALAAGAGLLGLASWRLYARADEAEESAKAWRSRADELIQGVYPDALIPQPGKSALQVMDEEILARRRNLRPPERTDQAMPILEELETISMVLGSGKYALESIELKSQGSAPTIIVIAESTADAEALAEALNRIGGSHISQWSPAYASRTEAGVSKVQATFRGEWVPPAPRAGGTP